MASSISKAGPGRERSTAREKIFGVADDLFSHRGIQAVGVEEIVSKAGVAKISLYRSFPSKDDLVVAWLENRGADFWKAWDGLMSEHSEPRRQLAALMTHLARRTTLPGYLGCPFLKFCCEFPAGSHPGRAPAEEAKSEMRRRLRRIAADIGADEPDVLGDGLLLLVEGAYAISQSIAGPSGPGTTLPWAAEALVERALGKS